MLRAEIGPQRRPPPLTAEVEEVGLQMFHVEPMGRRGVRTVALVTCSGVGVGTTADFCLQHEAGVPTPMPERPCTPLNAVNLQASPQGVLPADVAEPDCPARTSKPWAGERGRPTPGASCCEQKSAPSAGRPRSPQRLRKRGSRCFTWNRWTEGGGADGHPRHLFRCWGGHDGRFLLAA